MEINYSKYADGLVPAIIQDASTNKVLMLGFMNDEAVQKTQELQKVTLFSRSKKRLWTKGEVSGNFLLLKDIKVICRKKNVKMLTYIIFPIIISGQEILKKQFSNFF